MRELPGVQTQGSEPCPPHDFGNGIAKRVHHFRNGHYWLICRRCKFTVRSEGR